MSRLNFVTSLIFKQILIIIFLYLFKLLKHNNFFLVDKITK